MLGISIKNANPFVLIMQSKMAFLAWRRYAEENWTRIQHHKKMGMSLRSIDPSSSSDDSDSSFESEPKEEGNGNEIQMVPSVQPKIVKVSKARMSEFMEQIAFTRLDQARMKMDK